MKHPYPYHMRVKHSIDDRGCRGLEGGISTNSSFLGVKYSTQIGTWTGLQGNAGNTGMWSLPWRLREDNWAH